MLNGVSKDRISRIIMKEKVRKWIAEIWNPSEQIGNVESARNREV